MKTKECYACKEIKSIDLFNKDMLKKDMLCVYCKDCAKSKRKSYYKNNKDKFKKYQDNCKEYQKAYKKANKDKLKVYKKPYYKKYRINNADRLAAINYLRRKFSLSASEIPPDLLNAKIEQLKLTRLIKKGRVVLND